jgi:hypothetical protein
LTVPSSCSINRRCRSESTYVPPIMRLAGLRSLFPCLIDNGGVACQQSCAACACAHSHPHIHTCQQKRTHLWMMDSGLWLCR